MLVISFLKNSCLGGIGDRIVGLISIKLIAALLGRKFYILWNKEDIRSYIDYEKYDLEKHFDLSKLGKFDFYNLIDKRYALKDYLMRATNLFPAKKNVFALNHEVSQYLYKNPNIRHASDFKSDILHEYKGLFTDILKPTKIVLDKVQYLVQDSQNIIGIQIRAGDVYMKVGRYQPIKDLDHISNYLLKIKSHIEREVGDIPYSVFITSDCDDILVYAQPIFKNIIYNNDPVQHIDLSPLTNADFSKIFVDLYLLSQKTSKMYISDYSNFGRIAALTSTHDEIYNLECGKLEKISLVSKLELLI